MKRVLPRILVLCVLLAGAWYAYTRWWPDRSGDSGVLTLYGNVETRQVDLAFRVGGRILELTAEEGAPVREGDILARLDAAPFEDEVRVAEANAAMQEATLGKARSGYRAEEVTQARAVLVERNATLNNMRLTLSRVEALRKSGGISQQDLDNARARFQEAQARAQLAESQLGMMEAGFRLEDVAAQEAALEAARAVVAKARTALDDTVLRAPESGIVQTKVREKGAVVQPGQTVYTLALSNPVHIRAYVPQPRLGLVKPGARVMLEVDAMPGKRYAGTVGHISPTAEFTPKSVETREVRNDLVFRIRITAEDPDNVMRQGMPVTITFTE